MGKLVTTIAGVWLNLGAEVLKLADRVAELETALVEACERLANIAAAVEDNGCDCDCDHSADEHAEDCERCLACCVCAGLGVRDDLARLRHVAKGESTDV